MGSHLFKRCFPTPSSCHVSGRSERRPYTQVQTLREYSKTPARLAASVEIFHALTHRFLDGPRWTVRAKEVKPLLKQGIEQGDEKTRELALAAQEALLERGLFEFRDLDGE